MFVITSNNLCMYRNVNQMNKYYHIKDIKMIKIIDNIIEVINHITIRII